MRPRALRVLGSRRCGDELLGAAQQPGALGTPHVLDLPGGPVQGVVLDVDGVALGEDHGGGARLVAVVAQCIEEGLVALLLLADVGGVTDHEGLEHVVLAGCPDDRLQGLGLAQRLVGKVGEVDGGSSWCHCQAEGFGVTHRRGSASPADGSGRRGVGSGGVVHLTIRDKRWCRRGSYVCEGASLVKQRGLAGMYRWVGRGM